MALRFDESKPYNKALCRGPVCKAYVYWQQTESGAWMCWDLDKKTPHWATCPDAKRFKRPEKH